MRASIRFLAIAILFVSCRKQGPDGPAGPEGPAGNPGPSIGGAGIVRAYTTASDVTFSWREEQSTRRGVFNLAYTRPGHGTGRSIVIPEDSAVAAGALLVYLKVQAASEEPVWRLLPMSTDICFYEALYMYHEARKETGLRMDASVKQSGTTLIRPDLTVSGLRVVVIPAANVIGNQSVPNKKFADLELLMKTYNIKERDFETLE